MFFVIFCTFSFSFLHFKLDFKAALAQIKMIPLEFPILINIYWKFPLFALNYSRSPPWIWPSGHRSPWTRTRRPMSARGGGPLPRARFGWVLALQPFSGGGWPGGSRWRFLWNLNYPERHGSTFTVGGFNGAKSGSRRWSQVSGKAGLARRAKVALARLMRRC